LKFLNIKHTTTSTRLDFTASSMQFLLSFTRLQPTAHKLGAERNSERSSTKQQTYHCG